MKKLLGIVVLGLLWCNVGFAEDLSKIDINKLRKLNSEEIITALSGKKLYGYYQFGIPIEYLVKILKALILCLIIVLLKWVI